MNASSAKKPLYNKSLKLCMLKHRKNSFILVFPCWHIMQKATYNSALSSITAIPAVYHGDFYQSFCPFVSLSYSREVNRHVIAQQNTWLFDFLCLSKNSW